MSTEAAETDTAEAPADPQVTDAGTTVEIPPDPPAKEPPAEKQSRADRRASKAAGWDQEAREARQLAERERDARHALELKVAELQGRVTAGEAGKPDPNQQALDAIASKMENVVARMGQGDDSARAEWHQLRREEGKIIARMEAQSESKGVEERITKAIPQPMDPHMSALMVEFPDLQKDEQFKAIANGHVNLLIARERRDMTNPSVRFATLREGAAWAAKELGRGGTERREPTARDRERLAGTASGDSGAGNGKTVVSLTGSQKKLAEQMFRNMEPEQAHIEWWKKIGHKIANKQ